MTAIAANTLRQTNAALNIKEQMQSFTLPNKVHDNEESKVVEIDQLLRLETILKIVDPVQEEMKQFKIISAKGKNTRE